MSTNLTDPIFHEEEKARAHFEAIRWPDGKPICPHCGVIGQATLVHGKSHRSGMYQCNACREPFTAMTGTIMESSHLPMTKWALAFHLMASSKKGYSAHQLMRTLGLGSYRTATKPPMTGNGMVRPCSGPSSTRASQDHRLCAAL